MVIDVKIVGKGSVHEKLLMGLVGVVALIFLLPLVVTIVNSLMTEKEITWNFTTQLTSFDLIAGIKEKFQQIKLIPQQVSLSQYNDVLLNQPAFLLLLLNSLKIAAPVTFGALIVALLSAYGFTVWKWKYNEIIFTVYIVVMLMPLQAVLVPNYIIADMLHIKANYLAIILPGIFSPFGVFLMRQSMKFIPPAYFEAAHMDGANHWQIFWRVVMPQLKSSIAALCMLVFIEYWNLVEQAVIFIDDYTKEPLSVFLSRMGEGWMGIVFSASCLYMFLPLWFLLLGQKDLEKGIELSGVK
ncbi:MAG: carbohydrate ABC transporter permease [Clostridiales bacterium]|jgi:multiple sugar transport system permease protein|nr:carbohydrate ABC transporter permease [Clostridiales bacterium]